MSLFRMPEITQPDNAVRFERPARNVTFEIAGDADMEEAQQA
jgi:hypothetical protein